MHYAIAIWNFSRPDRTLEGLIEEFADAGFDAVSFLPAQILRLDEAGRASLRTLLARRGLVATVHGKADLPLAQAQAACEALGPLLRCFTFDAVTASDSCGTRYDTPRMAALLAGIEAFSRGGALTFAIEDFPLDRRAWDCYRRDLEPLRAGGRLGLLLDLGHMNLRRTAEAYFRPRSVGDYLRGACATLPVVELHIHDNDGTRDSHLPLGAGTLDVAAVAACLRELSFDGVSTIEVAPSLHGATPEHDMPLAVETLRRWRGLIEGR